jgi:methionyl-tRNA formyltransferase
MRLVFFGTGSFAVPALRVLAKHVVLAVAQPDRRSGRGLVVHPSPVRLAANEFGVPLLTPEKCRDPDFVEVLRKLEADAMVVASYGQILSQAVLDATTRGGINLHGSILPKYRGAAPIQRAILRREKETGVTLMQMARGMDTGDIIALRTTNIDPDETYGELQDRLAILAAGLAAEWMPRIIAGQYPRAPQRDEEATYAPKVEKHEAQLDFNGPAVEEYAKFRAFTPSPGATIATRFGRMRISRARRGGDGTNAAPGTVLSTSPVLSISFGNGALELLEVQLEGKKRASGRELSNGLRLKPGDSLIPA